MAEIRIPYDRIPADIWRRLRDISNEVISPFTSQENTSAASSSLSSTSSLSLSSSSSSPSSAASAAILAAAAATASEASHTSSSIPSAVIEPHTPEIAFLRTVTTTAQPHTASPSTRSWENTGHRVSKNRSRLSYVSRRNCDNDDDVTEADCDVDEVDGGDVESNIVHVVDDATLRHQKSSRVSAMDVMDESDIVRIFPDADMMKSNPSIFPSEDSGIVRIFTNNDDKDDDDDGEEEEVDDDAKNDVVDHMSTSTKTRAAKTAFKISPAIYPNFVQDSNLISNDFQSVPFSTVSRDEGLTDDQHIGHYDTEERLSRKIHSTARFSRLADVRPKLLPGKSAKTTVYSSDPFANHAMLMEQQYKLMKSQSSPNMVSQFSQIQNAPMANSIPTGSLNNFPPSTPSKYTHTLETTPTKALRKSPSNFGKTRRSPGLLPTPPQTPDDADGDDDDEVFSYDVISRQCSSIDNNNVSNDVMISRRNSDSRAGDNERAVRRSSNRSSPFPFSPTHKLARMKVGDRQHTRKRLSFEGVDSTANASMTEIEHTGSQFWLGSNTISQIHSGSHPNIDHCQANPSVIQKMNNPPRGKSISPFNSPPRSHKHNPAYLSTSPSHLPTSPAPFPSCDDTIDNDRHLNQTVPRVQVCCSGSISCQSSPRSSHRQLLLPTNCQSSLNAPYSDQSYSLVNALQHDVTKEDDGISALHHTPYSPSHPLPFWAERKPRQRFHSEGFSEDSSEQPEDSSRSINSNNDGFFHPRPRGQTMSSYGKRRRLESDENGEESEFICPQPSPPPPPQQQQQQQQQPQQPQQQPLQTTPKKLSPTLGCPKVITSPNSRHHVITSPPPQQSMTSPKWPITQHTKISTPHDNCSCATFMRNFLSMASCAYKNVNAPTVSKLRQEMAKTNDMLRESMSIMNNIMAMCEHHKTSPTASHVGETGLEAGATPHVIEAGFAHRDVETGTATPELNSLTHQPPGMPEEQSLPMQTFHFQKDTSNRQ